MKLERRRRGSIAENTGCGGMYPLFGNGFPRIPRFLSAFRVQKLETAPFPIDDAIHEQGKTTLTLSGQ